MGARKTALTKVKKSQHKRVREKVAKVVNAVRSTIGGVNRQLQQQMNLVEEEADARVKKEKALRISVRQKAASAPRARRSSVGNIKRSVQQLRDLLDRILQPSRDDVDDVAYNIAKRFFDGLSLVVKARMQPDRVAAVLGNNALDLLKKHKLCNSESGGWVARSKDAARVRQAVVAALVPRVVKRDKDCVTRPEYCDALCISSSTFVLGKQLRFAFIHGDSDILWKERELRKDRFEVMHAETVALIVEFFSNSDYVTISPDKSSVLARHVSQHGAHIRHHRDKKECFPGCETHARHELKLTMGAAYEMHQ